MKKIYFLFCLLLLVGLYSSCDSNDSNASNQHDFAQNFGASASKDFTGQVVDASNHPIQSVTITIGNSTAQTDINGIFIINGASVYEKFAYIKATKVGYLDGSRSLIPTSGKNSVKIMLIPNTPLQTVQSGVASEVALASGTKVNFDGAFKDENGAIYSGPVQVSIFHLKPSDQNLNSLMPGSLYAQRADGNEAGLETFGMLNVELRGSGGQKLNIANEHTAEITIKIDDSQLATAPNTIPLWHFDAENGYWKEDGEATKIDNKYVGTVSHFSWWNFDLPYHGISLTTTVVDSNGNPLSNVTVKRQMSNSYPIYQSTNANGQIIEFAPADTVMTLTLLDLCGNTITTTSIGPFTGNTVLPNIVVTDAMAHQTLVQGTLLNCNHTNVANGYVLVHYGANTSVATVSSGAFSFSTLVCSSNNSFTLQGIDFDNLQSSGVLNYTFSTPVTNIGALVTCTSVAEFISYQIDSNPPVILLDDIDCSYGVNQPNGIQFFLTGFDGVSFYLKGTTCVPGVYTNGEFYILTADIGMGTASTGMQFNLSQFGAVGEYVDMAANGTYVSSTGITHTMTVTAHVIRNN